MTEPVSFAFRNGLIFGCIKILFATAYTLWLARHASHLLVGRIAAAHLGHPKAPLIGTRPSVQAIGAHLAYLLLVVAVSAVSVIRLPTTAGMIPYSLTVFSLFTSLGLLDLADAMLLEPLAARATGQPASPLQSSNLGHRLARLGIVFVRSMSLAVIGAGIAELLTVIVLDLRSLP